MTYSNDVDNAKFIQKTILRHEKKMGNIAQEIIANNSKKHLHSYKTDDYSLYLFEKDSLIDWHNATFPNIDTLYHSQKKVETTNNGWYYIVKKDSILISDNNQPQDITAIADRLIRSTISPERTFSFRVPTPRTPMTEHQSECSPSAFASFDCLFIGSTLS